MGSVTHSCPTLWNPVDCSTPGFPVHGQHPEFAKTHLHRVGDAIQPSHSLSSSSPSVFNFSHIRVYSNESVLCIGGQSIGVSASASLLPMSIQSWFPLGLTLCCPRDSQESPPTAQFKSISSSHSAFFMVQHSHPYMTTGKIIALTRWTLVGKVIHLLFNMLSRLVIAFLPRRECLLISWLQSPSAVTLEPKKIKACHCFYCFSNYLPWSDGTGFHGLHFLNVEF